METFEKVSIYILILALKTTSVEFLPFRGSSLAQVQQCIILTSE